MDLHSLPVGACAPPAIAKQRQPSQQESGVAERQGGRNDELAAVFDEIAARLLLQGAGWFKVRAYREGAAALRAADEPVEQMSAEGRLASLPHVGKAIAEKSAAYLGTGSVPLLERLRAETPSGLLSLLAAGLAPAAARALWQQYAVEDSAGLRRVLAAGSLQADAKLRRAAEQALATLPAGA